MSHILIVDDESSICWAFRESLGDDGHLVDVAATAEEGLRIAAASPLDVVVLDVRLPGMDGLTAMRSFRERHAQVPIIIITAFGNLETAVRALEGGAFDYLVKPFDLDQATAVVKRALEKRQERAPAAGELARDAPALIGSSPAMQELFKTIALVAPTAVPVLITGESGTGKEMVARAIHRHSGRRDGPFLPICVAALNPGLVERELFGHVKGSFTGAVQDRAGLLELASGGTVLLDEIGDVSPSLQVKLLRAIEHREVTPVGDARPRFADIRVIAATNRPLGSLMAAGEFREDLFFRLSVFQIHLPPLRERRDDIPALAEHFLRQAHLPGVEEGPLAGDVLDELRGRFWTGNVRELRNAIEHAAIVARGQPIRREHLPPAAAKPDLAPSAGPVELQGLLGAWARNAFRAAADPAASTTLYEQFLELTEPAILRAILEECGQNRAAAAQVLGIHRATLRQKLRKYGIE
jgi:two-component system nitrogen regulation response regulator GlnG